MRISNNMYNFLKWFALVAIPAFEAFWLTVGKVWSFPYLTEIGTTIAAVGLLIAALIGVSTKGYRNLEEENANSPELDNPFDDYDIEEEGEDDANS